MKNPSILGVFENYTSIPYIRRLLGVKVDTLRRQTWRIVCQVQSSFTTNPAHHARAWGVIELAKQLQIAVFGFRLHRELTRRLLLGRPALGRGGIGKKGGGLPPCRQPPRQGAGGYRLAPQLGSAE
jgi:hypothetical protein